MTSSPEKPTLDDVIETHEYPRPDHHAHGKQGKHVDESELAERTELEREEVDADQS